MKQPSSQSRWLSQARSIRTRAHGNQRASRSDPVDQRDSRRAGDSATMGSGKAAVRYVVGPAERQRMTEAALTIARPEAAATIAEAVVALAEPPAHR